MRVPGDVSSQYVTALMLVGPYLPGGLRLELTTPLVSRPYVEMTVAVMSWFGHDAVTVDDDMVAVGPGRYLSADVFVEPDASSASYPLAVAALTGGTVDGAGPRGRRAAGRRPLRRSAGRHGMHSGSQRRRGTSRPDLPIERSPASTSTWPTSPTSCPRSPPWPCSPARPPASAASGFIRGKESDRLGDLAGELRTLGADVDETDDGLLVRPSGAVLHGGRLGTHHDHRLAMAFGVVGSVVDGVEVEEPDVVSKSWPGFWSMLDGLRMSEARSRGDVTVAVFDFDETITHRDSVVPFLRLVAGTRRLVVGLIARSHRVLPAIVRRDRERVARRRHRGGVPERAAGGDRLACGRARARHHRRRVCAPTWSTASAGTSPRGIGS